MAKNIKVNQKHKTYNKNYIKQRDLLLKKDK